MIIWGSKGKTKEVSRGYFYCPKCQRQSQYIYKEIGKYFTLYFIPLFRTSMLGDYIECQTCFTPFEKTVLEYDHKAAENVQKLLKAIEEEINAGLPIQFIYNNLLESGADKDSVNMVISMATKGKMKTCKSCELIYSASLNYCSVCGKSLLPVD